MSIAAFLLAYEIVKLIGMVGFMVFAGIQAYKAIRQ